MYCGRCGRPVADSSPYCSRCGFNLHMGVRRSLLDERFDPLKLRHAEPLTSEDLFIRGLGVLILGILCFLVSSKLMETGQTPDSITLPAIVTSLALLLGGFVYFLAGWYGNSRHRL